MMTQWIKRMLSRQEWRMTSFGQAELVQKAGGAWELRGGSASDLTAAKEWISLFHHEAVPAWRPRGACPIEPRGGRAETEVSRS